MRAPDQPAGQRPNAPQPPPRRGWWFNLWWVVALGILIWNFTTLVNNKPTTNPVLDLPYSVFLQQVNGGNVSSVAFQSNDVSGRLKQAITYSPSSGAVVAGPGAAKSPPASAQPSASASASPAASAVASSSSQPRNQESDRFQTLLPSFGDPTLLPKLEAQNVQIKVNPPSNQSVWLLVLENVLPWLLLIGLFFLMTRKAGAAQQGIFSFGKSKARRYQQGEQRITFDDVAGVAESKADLQDIIDYLRFPKKYTRLGGRVPHGVLLVGQPGTGKTLLARATAGEANVPFFSISGPEFVEVLVGVGASRVRDLFETAKKEGPAIIFIDEIDAIGRRRGAGHGLGSNEEREQTLNQILVEMDGFDATHTVIVLAASNRADVLDPALLRPGRFDRQVTVDRPDKAGREAILRVHAKRVPLDTDVDLQAIARGTPGMVGADLANLVNEAALLAARNNADKVSQRCFWEALEKIQLGAERPLVLSQEDRRIVAYHESGHALVALLSPNADPLNRVTILPRGHALGVTLQLPLDDRYNYSKDYLMTRISVALGGRVAEETIFNQVTTGAENDLDMVSRIVKQMVTRWGMSERVGLLVQADPQGDELGLLSPKDTSEYLAKQVDSAMQEIIKERLAFTRALLKEHVVLLHQLAELLLEHESVDAAEIRARLGLAQPPTEGPPPRLESMDNPPAAADVPSVPVASLSEQA
ncbi:MAG TPA: ATP-dependent zinc metalloprotease FtsH [Chloroflexota bacterium]|nr:ATP-dependent zinc metalloprotease FtsH [Chloroflexota bacterium]